MRQEFVGSLLSVSLLFVGFISVSLIACGPRHVDALDPATLPENIRGDYAVFASRCSRCHALARPLNAGITDDEQWKLYVNRMRRQPGSGISMDDQTAVLRFLRHYAGELRAKKKGETKAPPPTASAAAPELTTAPAPAPAPAPALPESRDGGAD
jgi:hypothetical protein